MDKNTFDSKRSVLEGQVDQIRKAMDVIVNAEAFDKDAFDSKDAELSKVDAQLRALVKLGYDKPQEEQEEDEAFESSPAFIRSKGRKTETNIHEHAAREGFSVTRAIECVRDNRSLNGVEREVNDELNRISHRSGAGHFMVPLGNVEKLNQRANFDTGNGAAGVTPTLWDASGFVDFLYPMLAGPKLGVGYRTGMMAGTKVPRLTALPTVTAVAESGAATGSTPITDDIFYQAHALTAEVTYSYRAGYSSILDSDRLINTAGARSIAVKMETQMWNGAGSGNEATGLLNKSGTNSVVATSNKLSYANVIAAKKAVADANANFGRMAWLTSPAGYAAGETTPKIGTTFPVFVVNDDNQTINGEPVVSTSLVPSNITVSSVANQTVLVYGNWDFAHVALFGQGLYVTVDGISGNPGDTTIKFLMDFDVQFDWPAAFSVISAFN